MKTAVVFGCGSKRGSIIIDELLSQEYKVINIGSQSHKQCANVYVDWKKLTTVNLHKILPKIGTVDFLFFNQNSSSLDQNAFRPNQNFPVTQTWKLLKDWQHSHWISCQMPFLAIKYLSSQLDSASKIGWMLSSTMFSDRPDSDKFPDYSSQKYFNFLAMKCLSKFYQTFGILPDFSLPGSGEMLAQFIRTVCTSHVSSEIFDMHTHSKNG